MPAFLLGEASAQVLIKDTSAADKKLFAAVRVNDMSAVQASITAGADVNAVNSWGLTPPDLAVDKGYFEIAHFLLSLSNLKAKKKKVTDVEPEISSRPKFLPQSKGDVDTQKAMGYGVVKRKSSGNRKTALPPMLVPSTPVARAEPTPIEEDKPAGPTWPEGKPNPFDPNYVAVDSQVTAIGAFPSAKTPPPLKPIPPQNIPHKPKIAPPPLAQPEPAKEVTSVAEPAKPAELPSETSVSKPIATPQVAPAAVDVASTSAATGAAESKGFMSNMLSILTFGLLDGDEEDKVAVDSAQTSAPVPLISKANSPVQLTPKNNSLVPQKQALRPPQDVQVSKAVPALPEPDPKPLPQFQSQPKPKSQAKPQPKPKPQARLKPARTPSAADWSVKKVQTAKPSEAKPSEPMIIKPTTPSLPSKLLQGAELTMGLSVKLGSPLRLSEANKSKFAKPCVEKSGGSVAFCIKPVDWPPEIEPLVLVGTVMYTGLKTIVRYDEGRASRFHTLFPSASFDGVVAYYTRRFGQSTQSMNRSIAPLAARRQNNPTALWQSVNPVTKQVTTLEVRKFDDTRGGFPDTDRGAIMLYHQWSKPIFPQLSTVELMLLRPKEVL